jgi:hypothetical protein
MHARILMAALAAIPVAILAYADTAPSPYADQRTRAIKALSPEDLEELRTGAGMGLAKAAHSESRGADEENARDAGACEDEKNTGHRKSHQRSESPKCQKGRADAHPVDAKAEKQHHSERRQHHDPAEFRYRA